MVASAVGACTGTAGSALDVGVRSGTRLHDIPVENEHVYMMAGFRNVSDVPISIRSIRLSKDERFDEVAQVVRVELGPIDDEGPALGVYEMYPPVVSAGDGCQAQPTRPVDGYVLEPSDKVAILIWIRALAPGGYRITSQHVVYDQEGRVREQTVPFEIEGRIESEARPLEAFPRARRCANAAKLLPGWRLP